jgi:PAS domain S-box-containing protein
MTKTYADDPEDAERRAAGGGPPRSPDDELERLTTEARFHERLRDLTVAFSRDVSSTLTHGTALEAFALDANALLEARRTSIWIHQRRERELALAASSDVVGPQAAARVPADDPATAPARGLRLDRPVLVAIGGKDLLLAPLRGWRRALGTLVLEAPFGPGLSPGQRLSLVRELSRQLSAAIENIQLLEEVLQQRRLLEDTFNSLIDPIVVIDSARRVVQMNDALVSRTGLSRAELLERPLDRLVGPDLAAWIVSLESPAPDAPDAGLTRRFEDPRLGGTFWVTVTPLVSAAGAPAGRVLVARDVTEQTRLEEEREALRERLAQSHRLASLGQFVAGVAHEMNNPLQGVLGHLELMIETSVDARPLRRDLKMIYQEADRAAKIVRNLLVFTGSRRMERRRLRLTRVLSRVLASRAAVLERQGITVVRDDAEELPWVTGDPALLHQAFLNILINAEHAINAEPAAGGPAGGGRIAIRTEADRGRGMVVATIHDSGPGIPPAVLPRIFDPFFTTKEVGQGTGLGLAITYGIVQDHDGSIYATNPAGGGAAFTVELPAAAGATGLRAAPRPHRAAHPSDRVR